MLPLWCLFFRILRLLLCDVLIRCKQCSLWVGRREYSTRHWNTCTEMLNYEKNKKEEVDKQVNERFESLNKRKIIETKEKFLLEGLGSSSDRIILNVGGKKFYTTKRTLWSFSDSLLSLIGTTHIRPYDNGEYFLDRDPDAFKVILKYLRSGGELHNLTECNVLK